MKIKQRFFNSEDSRILFISDLHIGHKNILTIDKRPYKDMVEMTDYIIQELNQKVRPNDLLFDLGDMFFAMNNKSCLEFLDKIPTKNLYKIMGNHDKQGQYIGTQPALKDRFVMIEDILTITVVSNNVEYQTTLCHYPIFDYPYQYHGGIHIFGHTHGHMDSWCNNHNNLMVDIGFNAQLAKTLGTFVISFDDILNHFYNKTGGISFKKWADEKYHEPDIWNDK